MPSTAWSVARCSAPWSCCETCEHAGPGSASVGPAVMRRQERSDARGMRGLVLPRLTIEDVRPRTPAGMPAKAVVGERVPVSATIFRDGHDVLAARVRWRRVGARDWRTSPLRLVEAGLDQWAGELVVDAQGDHEVQIEAWTDRFATWRHDAEIKASVGDPELEIVLEEGARLLDRLARRVDKGMRSPVAAAAAGLRDTSLSIDERLTAGLDQHVASLVSAVPDPTDLTRTKSSPLWVDRPRAREGAWYEMFPRSEGGLDAASKRLPDIAAMGFDVVYLPPVHPIGQTFRKGRNNTIGAGPDDPGSPWAIGSADGGHLAVAPELGTIDDFDSFVDEGTGQRPRGGARLRVAVLARPSLGTRASGVVPPPGRRLDRVRREPAEEVPGHLSRSTSGRTTTTTARRCGTRARRSSTTGSRTACSSSASTIRTRSRSRSGTG